MLITMVMIDTVMAAYHGNAVLMIILMVNEVRKIGKPQKKGVITIWPAMIINFIESE